MIAILHRRISPVVAGLIALTLLTSLIAVVDFHRGGGLYARLALIPDRVFHLQLWRLVTWPLAYFSAKSLIGALLLIYFAGSGLAAAWSPGRLARFSLGIVVFAALATCAVGAFVSRAWGWPHLGGMALPAALAIAYGLQFPLARVRVFDVLEISGDVLAYGTLGVTALFAVFYGWVWALPELFAAGAAYLYMIRPHRRLWRKLASYRKRKLGVIPGDRHGGPYYTN